MTMPGIDLSHRFGELERIFRAGVNRVSPYRMIHEHVSLQGNELQVRMDGLALNYNLDEFNKVFVIGAGKATAPMARAIEEILGPRLTAGVIVVKYGHVEKLSCIDTIEAGHPVPDAEGVRGARRVLELADSADESTLVINLISGGGSALLPAPAELGTDGGQSGLTLEDKQLTTQALLACGAEIQEINCVRKHLSEVKGGRLLEHIAPAKSLNLILSDVVGDDLSSIASGLTAPDPTTFSDALVVLVRYQIHDSVPARVLKYLKAGERGEKAESVKEGAASLSLSTNVLLGTNSTALNAAANEAKKLGYTVVRLTSRITGEAREVAKSLSGMAVDCRQQHMLGVPPVCIISGGEPVVTLKGSGKGGRNQEMALSFLCEMARGPELYSGICFLAASTDGNDGPTDAAGGFAAADLLRIARQLDLDHESYLQNNDAYTFFSKVGGLLKTGPTNTNVCDLHITTVTSD